MRKFKRIIALERGYHEVISKIASEEMIIGLQTYDTILHTLKSAVSYAVGFGKLTQKQLMRDFS